MKMPSSLRFEYKVPKLDNHACIDRMFLALASAPYGVREVELNLSGVGFITPAGAMALTLTLQHWGSQGGRATLVQAQSDTLSYLERINFFDVVGSVLERPTQIVERWNRTPNSAKVMEISEIPSDENGIEPACEQLTTRLDAILDRWFPGESFENGQLIQMVNEIAQNIRHAERSGYCCIQHYRDPSDPDSNRVHIAVGDLGIGIRQSFLQSEVPVSFRSDIDAIEYSLIDGNTSKPSYFGGGTGLHTIDRIVKKWGGTLTIRSGTGRITIQQGVRIPESNLHPIEGTQVEILVHKRRGEKEMFDYGQIAF